MDITTLYIPTIESHKTKDGEIETELISEHLRFSVHMTVGTLIGFVDAGCEVIVQRKTDLDLIYKMLPKSKAVEEQFKMYIKKKKIIIED